MFYQRTIGILEAYYTYYEHTISIFNKTTTNAHFASLRFTLFYKHLLVISMLYIVYRHSLLFPLFVGEKVHVVRFISKRCLRAKIKGIFSNISI